MNCRKARKLIALWIGHDLSESEDYQVNGHLEDCGPCRDYVQNLLDSSQALAACNDGSVCRRRASLWPEIQQQLPERPATCRRSAVAAPGVMLAAACVALVLSSQALFDQPPAPEIDFGRGQSVGLGQGMPAQDDFIPVYPDPSWQALRALDVAPQSRGNVQGRSVTGF